MGSGCSSDVQGVGAQSPDSSDELAAGLVTRPWQIVEKVALVLSGFDAALGFDHRKGADDSSSDDDDGGDASKANTKRATRTRDRSQNGSRGGPPAVVSADNTLKGTQMYVILDDKWWAGVVSRVGAREGGRLGKIEVHLFGAKRNAPPVVINLTMSQYRLRRAKRPFFQIGAHLEVLDQFVSKTTKRYKEQWRPATVVARDGHDSNLRVEVSFDGWGEQHNIWLDVASDCWRLRPLIEHAPRTWALSFFRGGRVGLENMGNTCYMNVALQALAHIRPLALYFLSGRYKRDINEKSHTKGNIASTFAQVVTLLW
jgi:hypothetical protein